MCTILSVETNKRLYYFFYIIQYLSTVPVILTGQCICILYLWFALRYRAVCWLVYRNRTYGEFSDSAARYCSFDQFFPPLIIDSEFLAPALPADHQSKCTVPGRRLNNSPRREQLIGPSIAAWYMVLYDSTLRESSDKRNGS